MPKRRVDDIRIKASMVVIKEIIKRKNSIKDSHWLMAMIVVKETC